VLGFKSIAAAEIILIGIERIHMRKHQERCACNWAPSLAERFDILAA
jgi:putative transposase